VRENTAHSLAPTNRPSRSLTWRPVDQLITKPLVISFGVIVRNALGKRSSQMPLAYPCWGFWKLFDRLRVEGRPWTTSECTGCTAHCG
jgi:hypothetical protein